MNHAPFNLYKTQDNFIQVAVVAENFWPSLIEAMELQHLDTQQNKNERADWKIEKQSMQPCREKFSTNTTEYWIDLLQKHRVPCGPINNFSETFQDEDLIKRNMIVDPYKTMEKR